METETKDVRDTATSERKDAPLVTGARRPAPAPDDKQGS